MGSRTFLLGEIVICMAQVRELLAQVGACTAQVGKRVRDRRRKMPFCDF